MRLWPRSLAARTAAVLLGGLTLVQVGGLTLHTLDRMDLLHMAQEHEVSRRVMGIYRNVAPATPAQRKALLDEVNLVADIAARLSTGPPVETLPQASTELERHLHAGMQSVPMPSSIRPREEILLGGSEHDRLVIGLQMPEGDWLNFNVVLPNVWPWQFTTFLPIFAAMSLGAALLTLWSVRRLTAPVATLAAAAEALGRDVNAPPLPERGPTELAKAAAAFNTMAARIRRFVDDRTFLLTAIGHDLRTPITRLRLRAEFMEDENQRGRMLADLDELEAMISSTLTFGRDATLTEPAVPIDLAALVGTVLNEATDARPGLDEEASSLAGPKNLSVVARPVALKRALTNLVANALNYGGAAHAVLLPPADGIVTLHIDDAGTGIPPEDLERVFLPFHRLESSRNRETGGMGLGLPIARNILRAHGGDVTLTNRRNGGLRATVTLPI